MMIPIIFQSRAQGILVWLYLHKFLVNAPSAILCRRHTQLLVEYLVGLRIQVHTPNSVLTPTKSLVLLRFWRNLTKARVLIPPPKMQSLIKDVNRPLHRGSTNLQALLHNFGSSKVANIRGSTNTNFHGRTGTTCGSSQSDRLEIHNNTSRSTHHTAGTGAGRIADLERKTVSKKKSLPCLSWRA